MNNDGKILMSVEDVMKALSVGRSTIYKLIGKGELRPIKIAGATRFKTADVVAWVDGLATSAAA